MDTQTITLFIACLLFAGANILTNAFTRRDVWLKWITLLSGLAGFAGAGYLLVVAFINHVK